MTNVIKGIKNIIFDYGNVIFSINFQRTQQAFEALGIKDVSVFYAHKIQNPLFDAFEKGDISPQEFRSEFNRIAGISLSDQDIDAAWNSLLIGVPEGNHEILMQVREKYRSFLLSNNNEIHYQWILNYLQDRYQIPDNSPFFEHAYYSQHTGMRKPNPEIFEMVLRNHDLNPAETLFIDDSPQHIEGAKTLGIHTLLMDVPATELPQFLKKHGIL